MIHKLLGRFRSEHLIDPGWDRVASGEGARVLEENGIEASDRIMAAVAEKSIHGMCEHIFQQEVGQGTAAARIPFVLARNTTMVLDVLVASDPGVLLERPQEDGMSLATFCAISSHLKTFEHLDAHMHLLGSCVRGQHQDQPLYASCYSRLPDTVQWMLDHGFDPNEKDGLGRGVLHQLAIFNFYPPPDDKLSCTLRIIDLLLEGGANPLQQDRRGAACINGQGWMCDQVRRRVAWHSCQKLQAQVGTCTEETAPQRL